MILVRELKNQITVLFSVLVISVTVILSTFLLQRTNFYIKNAGSSVSGNGEMANTINVTGDGKVFAKPDKASFSVSVKQTKSTSKQALEEVNKKIAVIKDKLYNKGIEDADIQTSNLSIRPDYNWVDNRWILMGQVASQTLTVSVKNIGEKAVKIAQVLDDISSVENVRVFSIRFDIEDKKDIFTQSRKLAYEKAEQKASELAEFSDVELLPPVSISDVSVDQNHSKYETTQSNVAFTYEEYDSSARSDISSGQLEVNVRLEVKFGINSV